MTEWPELTDVEDTIRIIFNEINELEHSEAVDLGQQLLDLLTTSQSDITRALMKRMEE